jgi:phosphohistidine phosphatase
VTRTLLVMRHGKSRRDEEALIDHDRPLAKRGKRDAIRVGEELLARGLPPHIIVTSTARRARSTARRVAKGCDCDSEIVQTAELYAADSRSCLEVVSGLPHHACIAMMVGHNPMLEEFVSLVTRRPIYLPTAALACVDFPLDDWSWLDADSRGELRFLILPRELPR